MSTVTECRYGRLCRRTGCWFTHSDGRKIDSNATSATSLVDKKTDCKFGADCLRPECKFEHPGGRRNERRANPMILLPLAPQIDKIHLRFPEQSPERNPDRCPDRTYASVAGSNVVSHASLTPMAPIGPMQQKSSTPICNECHIPSYMPWLMQPPTERLLTEADVIGGSLRTAITDE